MEIDDYYFRLLNLNLYLKDHIDFKEASNTINIHNINYYIFEIENFNEYFKYENRYIRDLNNNLYKILFNKIICNYISKTNIYNFTLVIDKNILINLFKNHDNIPNPEFLKKLMNTSEYQYEYSYKKTKKYNKLPKNIYKYINQWFKFYNDEIIETIDYINIDNYWINTDTLKYQENIPSKKYIITDIVSKITIIDFHILNLISSFIKDMKIIVIPLNQKDLDFWLKMDIKIIDNFVDLTNNKFKNKKLIISNLYGTININYLYKVLKLLRINKLKAHILFRTEFWQNLTLYERNEIINNLVFNNFLREKYYNLNNISYHFISNYIVSELNYSNIQQKFNIPIDINNIFLNNIDINLNNKKNIIISDKILRNSKPSTLVSIYKCIDYDEIKYNNFLVNKLETDCECIICFENYNKYDVVFSSCNHILCFECYNKLLNANDIQFNNYMISCPICRENNLVYEYRGLINNKYINEEIKNINNYDIKTNFLLNYINSRLTNDKMYIKQKKRIFIINDNIKWNDYFDKYNLLNNNYNIKCFTWNNMSEISKEILNSKTKFYEIFITHLTYIYDDNNNIINKLNTLVYFLKNMKNNYFGYKIHRLIIKGSIDQDIFENKFDIVRY